MNAPREASVGASVLVLGALACAVFPGTWTTALAAYLIAWFVLGRVESLRFSRAGLMVFGVLAVVGLALGRDRGLDQEAFAGTVAHLEDRLRLEGVPAIAPSVVHGDHPQDFYVHAPGAVDVRVRLGPRGATLDAAPVGQGLFRVHYDPRLHGEVALEDGPLRAFLYVDGATSARTLEYASPLAHPRALCASPSGHLAATPSLESDELFLVDIAGRVHAMGVGDGPTDCVFLDDTRVAVSHRFGPTLWVVDAVRRRVMRRVELGAAERLALAGTDLAVVHSEAGISILDTITLRPQQRIDVRGDQVVFADEGTLLVSRRREADLLRFDRADGWAQTAALPLGRPAVALAAGAEGTAFVSVTDYVRDGRPHLANHFVQDQILRVDVASMVVESQNITARRSHRQGSAGDTDRGISPMGLHVSEDGVLWAAFAGSDELWSVRDDAPPTMEEIPDVPAPHDVTRLGDVMVVTSPSMGLVATKLPGGWRVVVTDDDESARRRGERAFYEGTRAGISCQSCHLHGDTDFVLRNIGGERLAPTLGVGGVADTAPFLRDASYPRLRDLEHLAQTLFRGYLRRDGRRGADMEAYMRGLPRRRVPRDGRDEEREERGLGIFVDAACTTCHAFPAFTNLAQIPAGALFPDRRGIVASDEVLDTPSLLSVSTHGPYLSDGRAETLEAVFRQHNSANRHGNTQNLSDDELADLIYFLEGL